MPYFHNETLLSEFGLLGPKTTDNNIFYVIAVKCFHKYNKL